MPIFVDNFENWVGDLSVKHAILIRDPLEVSLSTILMNGQKVPYLESRHSYSIEEYMQAMLDMKNFLEQTGRKFKVFDSTFLNGETCEQFVQSVCNFGGLSFDGEKMLNMKVLDNFPDNWWVPKSLYMNHIWSDDRNDVAIDFHGPALRATTFSSQKSSITRGDLNKDQKKRLDEIMKTSRPIYEELKSYCM